MRRRRPVLEHMTKMAAAPAAMHFGPRHPVAVVDRRLDLPGLRIVEARPSRSALEFLLRGEQRLLTCGAEERARPFFVIKRTTAGRLGAVRAHDAELLRREELAPLCVGVCDRVLFRVHDKPAFPTLSRQ